MPQALARCYGLPRACYDASTCPRRVRRRASWCACRMTGTRRRSRAQEDLRRAPRCCGRAPGPLTRRGRVGWGLSLLPRALRAAV